MYCHGMATLALTQVYGMTGDEEVKKIPKKAIDLIVKTQNNEGGWRYDPSPTGADISVTIMQVMALRGAKDSGLHVPDKTMTDAIKYINKCYDTRTGGYSYQPYSAGPGYARTAAGVCVLQLCGEYEADEHQEGGRVHGAHERRRRPRALLVRPLLRGPRLEPGRRRDVGEVLQEDARHAACARAISAKAASGTTRGAKPPTDPRTRPPSPSSSSACRLTTCRSTRSESRAGSLRSADLGERLYEAVTTY